MGTPDVSLSNLLIILAVTVAFIFGKNTETPIFCVGLVGAGVLGEQAGAHFLEALLLVGG